MTCGDKHVLGEASSLSRRAVEEGGEVVAEGTPEQVAKEPRSYTGHHLAALLKGHAPQVVEASKPNKARRTTAVRQREAAE